MIDFELGYKTTFFRDQKVGIMKEKQLEKD